MKINWGTGIVLAFLAFISFILFLVITMTTNKELDHDLVVEEYYKQELDFQNQLDKEQNATRLIEDIRVERAEAGFLLHFPKELIPEQIMGSILLYRTSDKQLDFKLPITLNGHSQLIPDARLVEGRWNIEIDWVYQEEAYYFQEDLTY